MNGRTYFTNGSYLVVSDDATQNRRLRTRGFWRLTTKNLDSNFYNLLRSLDPGSYIVDKDTRFNDWIAHPVPDVSR